MTTITHVAVVGSGVGGFATVQSLRAQGFDGWISLIDPEGEAYDRPPLSKGFLAGTMTAEEMAFVPSGWYADHGVEVIEEFVTALRPRERSLVLKSGAVVEADRIVLATGGLARRPTVAGLDEPGVEFLRTAADAVRLRGRLAGGARLVVLGAGLIGAEVASTASGLGVDVTLIDPAAVPLVPAMGVQLATLAHGMHEDHGVKNVTAHPERVERAGGAYRVVTPDGHGGEVVHKADVVLVAAGLVPSVELAQSAGLVVDDGVLVDAAMRTSIPEIYAIGDAARRRTEGDHSFRRAEHWDAAIQSGQTAAADITGTTPPKPTAHWFWSDRYGVRLEGTGSMAGPDTLVARERAGLSPVEFNLGHHGRLLGAAGIDAGKEIRAARKLIDSGREVTVEQLADSAVDLRKLK